MSDPITEHELELIEQRARAEGRPEVYGDDALRLVAEIRRLRHDRAVERHALAQAHVELDWWRARAEALEHEGGCQRGAVQRRFNP